MILDDRERVKSGKIRNARIRIRGSVLRASQSRSEECRIAESGRTAMFGNLRFMDC